MKWYFLLLSFKLFSSTLEVFLDYIINFKPVRIESIHFLIIESANPIYIFQKLIKGGFKECNKKALRTGLNWEFLQLVILTENIIPSTTYQVNQEISWLSEVNCYVIEGDFTYYGMDSDFDKFFDFLDSLKNWKHKIVIAGNHEIVLDENLSP